MSTNLNWKPAPKAGPKDHSIGDTRLKRLLARRLWDSDGSTQQTELRVDHTFLPYLEGLIDGDVDGAAELADKIREHGEILLWIE